MITRPGRLTPIDDDYETCKKTFATLRIYGDNLNPVEVTALLGIEPSKSQRKGEQETNSLGYTRTAKLSAWFLSSEKHVVSRDVRRHLDWLLGRLVPVTEKLQAMQREAGVRMAVTCVWSSAHGDGGPALWPEQMRGLADLDLECGFEIWFAGDRDAG